MKDESKTKKQLITELKKLRLENNRIKKSGNVIDEIVRERLENEKKFRQLYETMPVAYQSLDRNGKILDVNKIWCKALGFNREEVIGKHFAEFLTDESKKKFKIAFRDFRKKGTKPDTDYEMRNKDGEIIIISYTGRAAYDKSGTFIQTHCLLEDITEKKRTEIKLKKDLEQQKVLSQVTHLLTDLKNFDSNLNKALQLIGEHHNVSRVYIFEDTEDGKFTNNTFEWCNVGIEPQIDELQDFPYSILPSWKKILKKKGMILSQNIYKLPRDITFILEPQGIKAILVLPIFVSDKMYGFIGFDECIKHREWEE
ncbi:MAG: PAS domain S-box protein, partial [Ignavibacteria bacterium]|nr:PAS domain S-box protein [Ignavibacteria bacterium]